MGGSQQKPEAPPRGKRILIVGIAASILGASAAATAAYFLNFAGGGTSSRDRDRPALVRRDGTLEPPTSAEAGRSTTPDPSVYVETYIPLEEPFTSNLSGGANFIQANFALSTYYDERVTLAVEKHRLAIRSSILVDLSQQDPIVLASPEGKRQLLERLRDTVNRLLVAREGFGGIHRVYFTGLVIQ